ncbi:MAG: AAA family ATPase [Myxococcota bacterium]
MAQAFPAPPSPFVGRKEYIERFRARLEHFRLFIYEGIAGVGKTSLILRLSEEARAIGANQGVYLSLWPGETITSILGRVEARFKKVTSAGSDRQGDPFTRLCDLLDSEGAVLVIDELQHIRREDLLALARASAVRTGAYRIVCATRSDPELSAIDRMQIHYERVGQLSHHDVYEFCQAAEFNEEELERAREDARRGGSIAHALNLRYATALFGTELPPDDFLRRQTARSVNAFRALIQFAGDRFADEDKQVLADIASVGVPISKAVASKVFGPTVAKLLKRGMADVIDGDVVVHELVAQLAGDPRELSAADVTVIAKHLQARGIANNEPNLILRAAQLLAKSGEVDVAVETLAEGWDAVRDLGFLEAYLKAIASVPAEGDNKNRLRLLAARARMRQGYPSSVRSEMEELSKEKDSWTKTRALAALVYIYSQEHQAEKAVQSFQALRKGGSGADELIAQTGSMAAAAMVQLNKTDDAEKLATELLSKSKTKDPIQEGELRRLLARVYSQSGRLNEAVKEARAAAASFTKARDLYHAATAQGFIGDLLRETGEFEAAREAFKEFLELAKDWGDRTLIQIAELADAWVALDVGDLTGASKQIDSVEKELSSAPTPGLRRYLQAAKAMLEAGRGQHESASRMFPQVIELWESAGQYNIADVLRAHHVRSLIAMNRLDDATAEVNSALDRLDEKTAAPRVGTFLRESALIRLRRREVKKAMGELAKARKLFQVGGNKREEALTLHRIAHAAFEEGDFDLSRERVKEAYALAKKIKHDRAIAMSTELVGRLKLLDGDGKEAVADIKEALAIQRRLGDELGQMHCSESLLRAMVVAGDLAGAIRLGPRVSDQAEKLEIREVRVRAIVLTGVALLRRDRPEPARRCFKELKEGSVSDYTYALMYRFGEALASVSGEKAEARERRQRWVAALERMSENRQPLFVRSLEQLVLPPRMRARVRVNRKEFVVGTEELAMFSPEDYDLTINVVDEEIVAGTTVLELPNGEGGALFQELTVAAPKGVTMKEAYALLFDTDDVPDKPGKEVMPTIRELQKALKPAKSLKFAVPAGAKDMKLGLPSKWCIIVPTRLTVDGLTSRQKKVLAMLQRLGTVPVQTIQDEFDLSRAAARKEMGALIDEGLVEAVRAGRGQAFRLA